MENKNNITKYAEYLKRINSSNKVCNKISTLKLNMAEDSIAEKIDEAAHDKYVAYNEIMKIEGMNNRMFKKIDRIVAYCLDYFEIEKKTKGNAFFPEDLKDGEYVDRDLLRQEKEILSRRYSATLEGKEITPQEYKLINLFVKFEQKSREFNKLVEDKLKETNNPFVQEDSNLEIMSHQTYNNELRKNVEIWEIGKKEFIKYDNIQTSNDEQKVGIKKFNDVFCVVANIIDGDGHGAHAHEKTQELER